MLLIGLLFVLGGCSMKNTVREATAEYLDAYVNLDQDIVRQLNNQARRYYKNDRIRSKYVEVVKRQYSNMNYDIVKEEYDDEFAYATVRIDVYDLYKVTKEATDNVNKFLLEDGQYDRESFNLYKLDKMLESEDRVSYDIVIKLLLTDDSWSVIQLSNDNLEKIHGIYNYGV